jgi:hypothetical protein
VRMPRYFFHIKRGQVTILDQNGIELSGQLEAEAEGTRRLQEILTESDHKGGMANRGALIIADEEWCTVLELPFLGSRRRLAPSQGPYFGSG